MLKPWKCPAVWEPSAPETWYGRVKSRKWVRGEALLNYCSMLSPTQPGVISHPCAQWQQCHLLFPDLDQSSSKAIFRRSTKHLCSGPTGLTLWKQVGYCSIVSNQAWVKVMWCTLWVLMFAKVFYYLIWSRDVPFHSLSLALVDLCDKCIWTCFNPPHLSSYCKCLEKHWLSLVFRCFIKVFVLKHSQGVQH